MNYYLDTEFLEGSQKTSFFKKRTPPTIDLISIGLVSEDGREYYAISKDFNLREAWDRFDVEEKSWYLDDNAEYPKKVYWLRENVLRPIFDEFYIEVFGADMPTFNYNSFKYLINSVGKTKKEIAHEVALFCNPVDEKVFSQAEFYAYYADYHWVVFCWLFGRMIDLPKGFPMYCKDLRQMLEEKAIDKAVNEYAHDKEAKEKYSKDPSLSICLLKQLNSFPQQINEHNALDDAIWNRELHKFLDTL